MPAGRSPRSTSAARKPLPRTPLAADAWSDARIEDRALVAFTVENGRITRMAVTGRGQAEAEALEAVGLSE